jgi:hypothetical protein
MGGLADQIYLRVVQVLCVMMEMQNVVDIVYPEENNKNIC